MVHGTYKSRCCSCRLCLCICTLLKRFPGKSIVEIYDVVIWQIYWLRFLFLLVAVLLISAAINLREYIEVIKIYVFPRATKFLIISFILVVVILVFLGFENNQVFKTGYLFVIDRIYSIVFIIIIFIWSFYRLYPPAWIRVEEYFAARIFKKFIFGETLVAVFVKS